MAWYGSYYCKPNYSKLERAEKSLEVVFNSNDTFWGALADAFWMMGGCFCVHFGPSLVKAAKFSLQRQPRSLSCEEKDQKVTLTMIFLPCKSVFQGDQNFSSLF